MNTEKVVNWVDPTPEGTVGKLVVFRTSIVTCVDDPDIAILQCTGMCQSSAKRAQDYNNYVFISAVIGQETIKRIFMK